MFTVELTKSEIHCLIGDLQDEIEKCQEMIGWRGVTKEERALFASGVECRTPIVAKLQESMTREDDGLRASLLELAQRSLRYLNDPTYQDDLAEIAFRTDLENVIKAAGGELPE